MGVQSPGMAKRVSRKPEVSETDAAAVTETVLALAAPQFTAEVGPVGEEKPPRRSRKRPQSHEAASQKKSLDTLRLLKFS